MYVIQYIKLPLLQSTLIFDEYSLFVKVLIMRLEVLILGQYLHFAVVHHVHVLSCANGPVVCALGLGWYLTLAVTNMSFRFLWHL